MISSKTDDAIVIGALVRHAQTASSAIVARHLPLVTQAMRHVAHPAIRNRGTTCGSIVHCRSRFRDARLRRRPRRHLRARQHRRAAGGRGEGLLFRSLRDGNGDPTNCWCRDPLSQGSRRIGRRLRRDCAPAWRFRQRGHRNDGAHGGQPHRVARHRRLRQRSRPAPLRPKLPSELSAPNGRRNSSQTLPKLWRRKSIPWTARSGSPDVKRRQAHHLAQRLFRDLMEATYAG